MMKTFGKEESEINRIAYLENNNNNKRGMLKC
uniref:Uncharacterized protein n=1 Tax=Rhizophora mucronata TaxID=61149 RepID=A0A2P2R1C1_RHIMU